MPNYSFTNLAGQTQDLFYHIADAPKVGETVVIDGESWRRIFTVPQANIAVTIDPHSKADFIKKLDGKNDNLGDTWARSAELSAKRLDKEGRDPVKEKYFDNYTKTRRGQDHPARAREKAQKLADETNKNKGMRELGISVQVND